MIIQEMLINTFFFYNIYVTQELKGKLRYKRLKLHVTQNVVSRSEFGFRGIEAVSLKKTCSYLSQSLSIWILESL